MRTELHRLYAALILVLLGSASGCVPMLGAAKAREADRTVPESFGGDPGGGSAASIPPDGFFREPQLVALIDAALANNQELNILTREMAIASAEALARSGEYLPSVGVGGDAGVERVGESTSQGASDADHGLAENLQGYRLGLFATWEVDIWNRLRNATKAAQLRYLASGEARRFMVTRVVAEIARSYYELRGLDQQLEVLQQNIQIQQDALEVARLQKQAARLTELAVQRFEAEVLSSRSRLFRVRQRITEVENRINFLVGRFPQPIERGEGSLQSLLPDAVQTGLPAQLLELRPDIRRAELEMAAAELDVEVAKAQFYPSLTLDASLGYDAFKLNRLFNTPESLFYDALVGVSAPLFNRRGLTANHQAANARQMQAVLGFEQALRRGVMEVTNQAARIRNLESEYQLKSQQVELLTRAIGVSSDLFNSARADYMEVLLTRRDSLEAQIELIETRLGQLDASVGMYQALGGGWKVAAGGGPDSRDAGRENSQQSQQ